MARNARLEEEKRKSEELEEEARRKALQEEGGTGDRRGSTMELFAGVVNPTIGGMGLNKVGKGTFFTLEFCELLGVFSSGVVSLTRDLWDLISLVLFLLFSLYTNFSILHRSYRFLCMV